MALISICSTDKCRIANTMHPCNYSSCGPATFAFDLEVSRTHAEFKLVFSAHLITSFREKWLEMDENMFFLPPQNPSQLVHQLLALRIRKICSSLFKQKQDKTRFPWAGLVLVPLQQICWVNFLLKCSVQSPVLEIIYAYISHAVIREHNPKPEETQRRNRYKEKCKIMSSLGCM